MVYVIEKNGEVETVGLMDEKGFEIKLNKECQVMVKKKGKKKFRSVNIQTQYLNGVIEKKEFLKLLSEKLKNKNFEGGEKENGKEKN